MSATDTAADTIPEVTPLALNPNALDIAYKGEGKEGQTGDEKLDSPHQTYIATYRIQIKS